MAPNAETKSSSYFENNESRSMARFDRSELNIGSVLGTGGFCKVYEIESIQLIQVGEDKMDETSTNSLEDNQDEKDKADKASNDDDISIYDDLSSKDTFNEVDARLFMSKHCMRTGLSGLDFARYAIKKLKPGLADDVTKKGIEDLAVEAKYLAVVEHPNIIKMRAVSNMDPSDGSFFIVLDRLFDTLEERIYKEWKSTYSTFSTKGGFPCCPHQEIDSQLRSLWIDRLIAAYDLASAFRYLHKHKIVYRDIKPENIGFDVRDDIKLFDFGFARELLQSDKVEGTDLYRLTGLTGSIRYMAPEVAFRKPYNLKCDVYSFGLLLFEMIALKPPFTIENVRDHVDLVFKGNLRPKTKSSWPFLISNLMKECWSKTIADRPDFFKIASTLRGQASALQDDPGSNILNRTKVMLDKSNASRHQLNTSSRGYSMED